MTLETDETVVEIPAPASGILVGVRRGPDDVTKVGEVVAEIVPVDTPLRDPAQEALHEELNAAVAAAPDDEAPRLVMADFLLDAAARGGLHPWGPARTAARGEYLSVVAALRRASPDEATSLVACRDALLSAARATAASLVRVGGRVRVEDGFVAGVGARLDWLAVHAKELFARAPITSLSILHADDVERLLALPRLEQLRSLELGGVRGDDELARILGSPRLGGVRRVGLLGLRPGPGIASMQDGVTSFSLHRCTPRAGFGAAPIHPVIRTCLVASARFQRVSYLFAPVCSITSTRRRRFFWAAWWLRPPDRTPFRQPDAAHGGARSHEDALREAERAAGHSLVEIDGRWARAWNRVLRGEDPWTDADKLRDAGGGRPRARPRRAATQPVSIWRILGVDPRASLEEIKLAFRQRALLLHPDHGGEADSFRDLRRAYEEALGRRAS